MKRLALTAFALILWVSLSGWNHLGWKWSSDDIPITYRVGRDAGPPGMTHEEAVVLIEEAYDRWGDVPCSPIDGEDIGTVDNSQYGFGSSNESIFTFDGGEKNNLTESGTNAAAVTHTYSNERLTNNGLSFERARAMNIVFNDGRTWGTIADVDAPDCRGLNDFLSTTVHEIGHGLGMAHSCESGEPCPDPVLSSATMFYAGGTCESHRRNPNPDDQAGITAIYSPAVDFEVDLQEGEATIGPAPLTATFSVPAEFTGPLYEFDWNFGDGSPHFVSPRPERVTHTWNEEGQFTVTLTAKGTAEECGGEFQTAQRKVGAVLACNAPRPTFEYRNDGDYTVQIVNGSALGAFECVTEFEWILDGDEDSSLRTFEPRYSFETAGTHSVTMRASGPGGVSEFTADVEVERLSDAGCNATFVPAGGSALALALGLLGVATRRRSAL